MQDYNDIFYRDKTGEMISSSDKDYDKIKNVIIEAQKITAELNNGFHSQDETNALFSRLLGKTVDSSLWLMPPFYTDYGKNIQIGKNVFINHACTFMDRGGIIIGDDVLIGPKVSLLTINHPLSPKQRHSTISKPIVIEKNVWIGACAIILQGVTIAENSVVAAGAIVNKDVPKNVVVAGIPAKIVKSIDDK